MVISVCEFNKCTDEELIIRLRQGESEIEEFLIDKYKNLVRTKARAMYLIGGETDDLIQEGMIGLFKAIRDTIRKKRRLFRHLQDCVSTDRCIVPSRHPID